MSCTANDHRAIKADPERLAKETSSPGKPQKDGQGAVLFYLRQCLTCTSTLAVPNEVELRLREAGREV